MVAVRVMQSFGRPRPTTNPYIVLLRDALVATDGVEHIPFSWRTALTGRYDVFHVHWPDTLLQGRRWWTRAGKRAGFAAMMLRMRLRRVAVVQTVHNLSDPDMGHLDSALIRALRRRTELFITLNETGPDIEPGRQVLVRHGHYRDWFAAYPTAAAVPGRVGYVGLIKPYKGIEALLAAFATAREADERLTLRIAGNPSDPAIAEAVRQASERTPGIEAVLRYVTEAEFAETVTSSTVVVLPYRQMHNSGAALAALSLGRPVLVPDNETNRALAAEVGAAWVRTFAGELDADDLVTAVAAGIAPGAPDLSAREWTTAGILHADAYRRAIRLHRGVRVADPRTVDA